MSQNILVTGAAGFIGSHLIDSLLRAGHTVTGVDNLSRGVAQNLEAASSNPNFSFVVADIATAEGAAEAFAASDRFGAVDTVWHMAANSDIGAGVREASVDLRDTFMTTFHTLERMKARKTARLAFASSSAIYGVHDSDLTEETGPLFPISNYGAMKLASEGLITAAAESHLQQAYIFRFPNVIGSRATHGVILDFMLKLKKTPGELEVLGDGTQQKPYLHVSELVQAMLWIESIGKSKVNCFNIASEDEGVSVRYIAEAVVAVAAPDATIRYTGGSRGWVGDVPKFSYSTAKLQSAGWKPAMPSREAVDRAIREIHQQVFSCKL